MGDNFYLASIGSKEHPKLQTDNTLLIFGIVAAFCKLVPKTIRHIGNNMPAEKRNNMDS